MEVILEERRGVPLYRCADPAWAGAAHGFSTRLGGVSGGMWESLNLGASLGDEPARVRENFRRFCAAAGADSAALVKNHQVHGQLVRKVGAADILPDAALPGTVDADGLITGEPGVCLAIFSGDCIPVLLYDPRRRVIAAAHAGWRGTALGIAAAAVERMRADYACDPADILAAIGPGIGPCCFETHSDVPDGLRCGLPGGHTALGADAEKFIRPGPREGKYYVDLKGANAGWLERAGVKPEHIVVCPACTACRPDLFWSHRRLGRQRGSMAAVLQLV